MTQVHRLTLLLDKYGVIAAVASAIIAALSFLFSETGVYAANLAGLEYPRFVQISLSSIFVLVLSGTVLYFRLREPKSRIRSREDLILDANRSEHLLGRGELVERVVSQTESSHLVVITGESGSGKSALIRGGLLHHRAFQKDGNYLPLYIDQYVGDYDRGLAMRIRDTLWSELGPDGFDRLGISSRAELYALLLGNFADEESSDQIVGGRVASVFERIQDVLGKEPILILDQFDDYLAANRHSLESGDNRLSHEEIIASSKTWNAISAEIAGKNLRVLVATTDAFEGWAIRVLGQIAPTTHLSRLDAAFIEEYLHSLTNGTDSRPAAIEPGRVLPRFRGRLQMG